MTTNGRDLARAGAREHGGTPHPLPAPPAPRVRVAAGVFSGATRRFVALAVMLVLGGCGVFRGAPDDPTALGVDELGADAAAWEQTLESLAARRVADPGEPYWPHRIAELNLARRASSVAPVSVPVPSDSGEVAAGGEVEVWLRRALEADPGYAPSLTLLSRLLYEEGRHFEAIEILAPAVEGQVMAGAAEVRACLALHQIAAGDVRGAEATLAPLEARGEHWAQVGSVLTYARLHGERYREAPRWAERALEAEESAANCNNFGIALLQEGKPKEARGQFLRALELTPEHPGALYNLAIVERFYFFDEAAALAYFQRYRAVAREDPDGLAEIFGGSAAGDSVNGGNP